MTNQRPNSPYTYKVYDNIVISRDGHLYEIGTLTKKKVENKGETSETKDWLKLVNDLYISPKLDVNDLRTTLETLFEKLSEETGYDAIALWLPQTSGPFMRITASIGLSRRYLRYFNIIDQIRIGRGLVGMTMSEGTVQSVTLDKNYKQKASLERWDQIFREEGLVSVLSVPLYSRNRIIGVLNVYTRQPHSFSNSEQLFVQALANQIAAVVENTNTQLAAERESEELRRQIDEFFQLQRVLELLDIHLRESIEQPLAMLADYMKEKFGTQAVAIFQNKTEAELELVKQQGLSPEYEDFVVKYPYRPDQSTVIGRALKSGERETSSRLYTDSNINSGYLTLMSVLGITAMGAFPFKTTEESGVLAVYYDRLHNFSEDELSVIASFAQFLGVSLANLQNFRRLSLEKEKTASIVSSLSDGVIVYDLDGTVTEVNKSAEKLLGLSREEILGKQPLGNKENSRWKNLFSVSQAPLTDYETTELNFTNDRGTTVKVTHLPLVSVERIATGSIRVLHDMTAEKQLDALNSSFVSTASHQIRTPLTGIRWGLEELLSIPGLNDEAKELISKSLAGTERLSRLVTDLMNVTRVEDTKAGYEFVNSDLTEIVKKVLNEVEMLPFYSERDIVFVEPDHIFPTVRIDVEKFSLAFRNLIDNAIQYTNKNGQIRISLRHSGNFLVLHIKDDGIGIRKEDQDLLFSRFYRAKNAVIHRPDGTGLGLYIAKQVINQHGGRLSFDSEEGKGTTFMIHLPVVSENN